MSALFSSPSVGTVELREADTVDVGMRVIENSVSVVVVELTGTVTETDSPDSVALDAGDSVNESFDEIGDAKAVNETSPVEKRVKRVKNFILYIPLDSLLIFERNGYIELLEAYSTSFYTWVNSGHQNKTIAFEQISPSHFNQLQL